MEYRTVGRAAVDEFVERRSRFLGAICPVDHEAAALEFIDRRRREFRDATHHVYAYVLREGQTCRHSDDGEPQGTAGFPALDVLLREGLTDCALVITRYFGGIQLGAGGLTRAYARAARMAVDAAGMVEMRRCVRAILDCDYAQYDRMAAWISESGDILRGDTRYTEGVEMELLLSMERLDFLRAELTERSAGSLSFRVIGEEYAAFPPD